MSFILLDLIMWASLLLFVAIHQYIHKVLVNVSSYLHQPATSLPDVFHPQKIYIPLRFRQAVNVFGESLLIAFALFVICWSYLRDDFIIIFARFSLNVIICQYLRAACFLTTRLPGPAPHCSASYLALHPGPKTLIEILTNMDMFQNCGDLIFSSHNIFFVSLCCVLMTYSNSVWKHVGWGLSLVFNACVLICRKHYTVDILLAYIIVYLNWMYLCHQVEDEFIIKLLQKFPF